MTSIINRSLKYVVISMALVLPFINDAIVALGVIGVVLFLYLLDHKHYPYVTYMLRKNGILLILLMIVLIYATVFSVSFSVSLGGFARFGSGIAIMLIIQWVLEDKRDIMLFIQLFVIGATMIAGYGVVQYFFKKTGSNLLLDTELHPDISMRVTSIMQDPNLLAAFLVMAIPFAVGVFFYKKHWLHKLIAIGAGSVMVFCLVLTYSRSAYMGFVAAIGFFIVFAEARLLFLLPVAVGGLMIHMPKGLESRIYSMVNSISAFLTDASKIQDTSAAYRLYVWNGFYKLFGEYKWFGVGLGQEVYKQVYGYYMDTGVLAVHAHSIYFEMLGELGIIGFIVLFAFILYTLISTFRMSHHSKSRFVVIFTLSAIAGIIGLMITGTVEYSWHYHKVFYTFFILIGILMALYNNEYRNRRTIS